MHRFRYLLLPFSWIYGSIMYLRNIMFDVGIFRSEFYNVPVISVGNITVGGTGKTPLTEHIVRLLQPQKRCAILSRGYGRKTRGVIIAGSDAEHTTIGDEPMQMKKKFEKLKVAVAESRTAGMDKLLALSDAPDVIVMDDAYQHRYVKPGCSILVTDFYRPMWVDFCFPAGNLRETWQGKNRCDLVVVNKCPPSLSVAEADIIRKKMKMKHRQPVFFTSISYGMPQPLISTDSETNSFEELIKQNNQPIVAVAGIGNPKPFFEMVKKYDQPVVNLKYPDHHIFSATDIEKIGAAAVNSEGELPLILTTEKDAVRLDACREMPSALKRRIWYIPIELQFLFEEKTLFDQIINDYVGKN